MCLLYNKLSNCQQISNMFIIESDLRLNLIKIEPDISNLLDIPDIPHSLLN